MRCCSLSRQPPLSRSRRSMYSCQCVAIPSNPPARKVAAGVCNVNLRRPFKFLPKAEGVKLNGMRNGRAERELAACGSSVEVPCKVAQENCLIVACTVSRPMPGGAGKSGKWVKGREEWHNAPTRPRTWQLSVFAGIRRIEGRRRSSHRYIASDWCRSILAAPRGI